jgi:hypothetical protein
LPVDRDDPEARIAELERQLADARAAAGEQRVADQPPHFSVKDAPTRRRRMHRSGPRRELNLGNAFWWVVALTGPVVGVTIAFGIPALLIAIAVCVVVAVGYLALERGNFDGEKIMGGLLGVMGGVAGGASVLTFTLPSSALWMSGIVCSGSHTMENRGPHFQCVSDAGSHTVNILAVMGLQALLIAVVLCAVVAVGVVAQRQLRKRT